MLQNSMEIQMKLLFIPQQVKKYMEQRYAITQVFTINN